MTDRARDTGNQKLIQIEYMNTVIQAQHYNIIFDINYEQSFITNVDAVVKI